MNTVLAIIICFWVAAPLLAAFGVLEVLWAVGDKLWKKSLLRETLAIWRAIL